MKKFLTSMCLGAGLFLGACTPDITAIQNATVQACGFLPTAVVIANLFPTPFTVPSETVAQAICSAVAAQAPPVVAKSARLRGARRASASITVSIPYVGIGTIGSAQVTGYFVR